MNPIVLGVAGYVLVQLAIGLVVSRRIRNEADYLLAGRSLGYGLAIFTLFATWFGAETWGPRSAVAAMVVSLVVQLAGTHVWKLEAPMAVSILASLVVFVVVAWIERRSIERRAENAA